ncbi:hypothetical protein [Polynucleobacter sp. JS-Fieb-80-E5]|uniref:hypothetical protein n=1 Tax=Polynucleobacter sp. JS-Fieb-80-E5 TaxID=2081050 RepID=UPI001C0E4452|nr:hypothetical protein [Polynucleobacter sp. JS-Fieb-80-E5]MBU3619941.1 hypothetical protein [Polynucleobacter sp. JS-Fieb-80-E5]
MQFLLFIASFASNFVVLFKVPLDQAKPFYATYSIANTSFSLLITLIFTWVGISQQRKICTVFLVVIACVASIVLGGLVGAAVIYPLAMLCGDYAVSQAKSIKLNTPYRAMMVVTTILFFIPGLPFEMAVLIRIGVSLLFYTFILCREEELLKLDIKSPIAFIVTVYIFYSGTLMAIPWLNSSAVDVKSWYLAAQVSLGLLLKRADFLTRSSFKVSRSVNLISYLGAFVVIAGASIYSFNWVYALLLTMSSLGLILAVNKLLIKKEVENGAS